ncbi:MAG: NAD-dependent epimerase/dehydratase family protein [Cellvibrionaceae bacterium]
MASQETVLLLGFGDIAKRLAKKLSSSYQITGVRRRSELVQGITTVQADCSDLTEMQNLLTQHFDVIVVTMTPSEMSDEGYEKAYVQTVKTLLAALAHNAQTPRLLIFVSSSSVYGQQQGEWVDEQASTEPSSYSGKRLLEAENLLSQSEFASCSVRFSGIYGPGRRRLIEQVVAGHGAAKEPVLYSNRIHSEDCAGILAYLIERQKTQVIAPVYLASDCEPTPLYDVKQWLAEQLALPVDHLKPKPLGRTLRSSKRCSNKQLLATGYQFQYPTFKEGYRAVLESANTDVERENNG